jgi:hypothetical protein
MRTLAKFLSRAGTISIAEWWLRNAVQHGDTESLAELAELLRLADRADEADRVMKSGLSRMIVPPIRGYDQGALKAPA